MPICLKKAVTSRFPNTVCNERPQYVQNDSNQRDDQPHSLQSPFEEHAQNGRGVERGAEGVASSFVV
jgi:hypothetical protein